MPKSSHSQIFNTSHLVFFNTLLKFKFALNKWYLNFHQIKILNVFLKFTFFFLELSKDWIIIQIQWLRLFFIQVFKLSHFELIHSFFFLLIFYIITWTHKCHELFNFLNSSKHEMEIYNVFNIWQKRKIRHVNNLQYN